MSRTFSTLVLGILWTIMGAIIALPAMAGDQPPAFPKGTTSVQAYTTFAGGIDAKEIFYTGAVGASYYVFNNLSLGLEASGYQVTQSPGHDTLMYEAMCQLAESPDLRASLALRGQENSKRFSWKKTAWQTLQVCQEAGQA